jgi:hypothetical protein
MSRIICQCNTADFRSIEHLALALKDPAMIDQSTLKRKEKLALLVMASAIDAGIAFNDLFKVKEILFWDNGRLDWKFLNVPGAKELKMKLEEPQTWRAFQSAAVRLFKE